MYGSNWSVMSDDRRSGEGIKVSDWYNHGITSDADTRLWCAGEFD